MPCQHIERLLGWGQLLRPTKTENRANETLGHCEAGGFQVMPPSEVSRVLVLARFQMVAWRASVARTPPKSSPSGEWMVTQCAPASVVSKMVPAWPTTQQTFSEGAEPAVRSANTLLICRNQEAPPSVENSIMPAWPARQRVLPPGAAITDGVTTAATRKAASPLNAARGAAGCGAAAAAR